MGPGTRFSTANPAAVVGKMVMLCHMSIYKGKLGVVCFVDVKKATNS